MECKAIRMEGGAEFRKGFNRDIVECKVFRTSLLRLIRFGFNRDIVECKDDGRISIEGTDHKI